MKVAQNTLYGMVSGLAAGLTLGGFMLLTGVLPKAIAHFGETSILKGFLIHLFFSSLMGAILGILFGRFIQSLQKSLLIGILYAVAWWIFAVWIITPLRTGNSIQLSISELTNTLPIFGGHSMFGLVLGGTFFILKASWILPMKWNNKIAIITHLIFWGLVFCLSVGITSQFFPISKAIPFSCLSLIIYCCIAYFNGLFIIPRFFKTGKFSTYFLLVGLLLTGAIILNILFLNCFIGEFSLKIIFQQGSTIIENKLDIQRLRIAPAFFTTVVILFISTVYKLVFSFLEKEQISMQLQNEKIQHELQFLRSQISPHFLFNALNNLHSIVQLNPPQAGDFILKLGEMLRFVLYESQNKMVSIATEIKYIEHFVFFQKEKDSRRQQISFTKKGSHFATFKLEPMLLIPIVENAFQHNHTDKPEQYFVHIHLELNDESLIFLVENNLSDEAKPTSEKELEHGIGLKNITRRLELLYPQTHQLKHGVEDEKYKVRLIIQRISNGN